VALFISWCRFGFLHRECVSVPTFRRSSSLLHDSATRKRTISKSTTAAKVSKYIAFSGSFAIVSSCLSVCLSAWNNSATTGRIFIKFYISGFSFFEKLPRNIVSLKSHKNNGCFTRGPMYIYDNISPSSFYKEKYFGQKLYRKSKHKFYGQ
jgi:hypothetical protein